MQLITDVGRGLLSQGGATDPSNGPHSAVEDTGPRQPHYHAVHIENWSQDVISRYQDFICRMNKYAELLETSLGLPTSVSGAGVGFRAGAWPTY